MKYLLTPPISMNIRILIHFIFLTIIRIKLLLYSVQCTICYTELYYVRCF